LRSHLCADTCWHLGSPTSTHVPTSTSHTEPSSPSIDVRVLRLHARAGGFRTGLSCTLHARHSSRAIHACRAWLLRTLSHNGARWHPAHRRAKNRRRRAGARRRGRQWRCHQHKRQQAFIEDDRGHVSATLSKSLSLSSLTAREHPRSTNSSHTCTQLEIHRAQTRAPLLSQAFSLARASPTPQPDAPTSSG
jgi:hypothetical protein